MARRTGRAGVRLQPREPQRHFGTPAKTGVGCSRVMKCIIVGANGFIGRHLGRHCVQEGDSVLGVHIPATGTMDYTRCCRSFSRSLPFFKRHFPEFESRAFTCSSWLLDRQLKDHLPADTNIIRFLNEWNLIPEPEADSRQTIERVFGDVGSDFDTWPQSTSLQQIIVGHMNDGGLWRMGAGIIVPDSGSFALNGE